MTKIVYAPHPSGCWSAEMHRPVLESYTDDCQRRFFEPAKEITVSIQVENGSRRAKSLCRMLSKWRSQDEAWRNRKRPKPRVKRKKPKAKA